MMFYLQNSSQYVGNDILWWAKNSSGYTTDIKKAEVYSEEEAMRRHKSRESDIPWLKDYIDARTRVVVDVQNTSRADALKIAGIKLQKTPKPKIKREIYRCDSCGRFMSEYAVYSSVCHNCGCDNRP